MTDFKLKGGATRRTGSRTTRRVGWLFVVLAVLLVGVYFTVTSSGFIKRFVLPRAGAALGADISVDAVSLSPFSKLDVTGLQLTPRGEAPLLTGGRVRARYSLVAFLKGRIEIEELLVDSATVSVVTKPDGNSNLEPLLRAVKSKSPKSTSPSEPPVVAIKSIVLTNVTLRQISLGAAGETNLVQAGPLNMTLSDVRNGGRGRLEFDTRLGLIQAATTNAPAAEITAALRGDFNFELDAALEPTALAGRSAFAVEQARGAFAELAGVAATLVADVSPTELKEVSLSFTRTGNRLGVMRLHGPFAAAKREGKLNLEVSAIDRHVLNLLGAASGIDFGSTTINTTNELELAKGGSVISVFGDLHVGQFQVIRSGSATPKVDVTSDYSIAVDQTRQSALIGSFKLNGTQGARQMLTGGLSSPMTITWGQAGDTAGAATLSLALTDIAFEDWRALLGDVLPAGKGRLEGKVATRDDGKIVNFEVRAHADNVSLQMNTQRIDGLTITLDATGEARHLKQFNVTEYGAQIFHAGQPAFSFQGTAGYDRATSTANAGISVLGALPQLSGMLKLPDAVLSSGVLEMQGSATQSPRTNLLTARLRLVDLTGRIGPTTFDRFGTDVDVELAQESDRLVLRKATGTFTENSKPGGKLHVTGHYAPTNGAADLTVRLENINQIGLRPWLEPWFAGKKLATAALNSTAQIAVTATGVTTVKADFALTNLTATITRTGRPTAPVNARLQLEAAAYPQSAQLRQCLFTLTPVDKFKNQLSVTGNVSAPSNIITGNLKITAESLDLTPLYDLVAAPAGTPMAATTPPPPAESSLPEVEPSPITAQFKDLLAEIAVDRLRIRETTVEKLSARAKLDGRQASVKPCFLTLNGAPVKAAVTLDLGVPGYRYDLEFDAQAVPLAPLVNTFQPDRRGQLGGQFTGVMALKGEGMTGTNLQKHLEGQVSVLMTNVNLSLGNTRTPVLRAVLDTVVGIPDLIRNPLGGVENLLGRLVNFGGQRGGWSDQMMTAPIEVIETRLSANAGRVRLEAAEVRSATFRLRATGDINLAPILTNSAIAIPVAVSLNRPLASQVGLVPADAPTNAVYYAMPQFLTVEGTLGKPVPKTDKLVLAELAVRTGAAVATGMGGAAAEKAGGILQKGGNILGGIFGGAKPSTNAPPTTTTNNPANPFDLFR